MEVTRSSKELAIELRNTIDEYKKVYADCTPQDIQKAIVISLEDYI